MLSGLWDLERVRLLATLVLFSISFPISPSAAADDWESCADEKPDAAIAACTRVIASGNLDAEKLAIAYRNRGIYHRIKSEYDLAFQDYDSAIALNPKFADAFNSKGVTHFYLGDYDHAAQDYSKAIELDPNYAIAYNNRGTLYLDTFDQERAIQDFSQAIKLNPGYTK